MLCNDGTQEIYDGCIMAVHAPDALRILGDEATFDERRILGAFQYEYRSIHPHSLSIYLNQFFDLHALFTMFSELCMFVKNASVSQTPRLKDCKSSSQRSNGLLIAYFQIFSIAELYFFTLYWQ